MRPTAGRAGGGAGRGGPPEAEQDAWIVGRRPVAEAVAEGTPIDRVWVSDDGATMSWWRPLDAAARALGAVITRAPREALDRLAGGAVHQGILARVSQARVVALEDVLDASPPPTLLVLADGVEDPRNLGAIVRAAAAAGSDCVVLPERRAAGLTPSAAKAAAGALGRIPLARVKNVQRALEAMAERDVWTVGLVAGAVPIWEIDLARPTCLIVGGEGGGLSRLARERCDLVAGIPLARGVESLNAATAIAVALFEAVRQRRIG